jgi:hypothetical protein
MENRDTGGVAPPSRATTPKPRVKRSQGAPVWVGNVIMLGLGIIIGAVGHWLIASTLMPSGQGSVFDQVVARTRHLKGNSNAPVTIIEFSDFQ